MYILFHFQQVKFFSIRNLSGYHNYLALAKLLQEYAANYSSVTQLFSIGKSVQNRELWVLRISDNPTINEPGEPEFKVRVSARKIAFKVKE